MFIKEVCQECKLTRKAVEYYEKQGLIQPEIAENGYRIYGEEEIRKLKEISLLRKLNISIADISKIQNSEQKDKDLFQIKLDMENALDQTRFQIKQIELLLTNNYDLKLLEKNIEEYHTINQSIREKLLMAFPGSFGIYLSLHFGHFLNEKIESPEKQKAYNSILVFLDQLNFPADLEEKLDKTYEGLNSSDLDTIARDFHEKIQNFEEEFQDMQESIKSFLDYKNSTDYQDSDAKEMKESLTAFLQDSGYYEIFIPNLKILSRSYLDYSLKIERANQFLMNKYPDLK